jgi:hypothetical protein
MRAAALRHIDMAMEVAALCAAVSSTVDLVLGHSPNETFWVEVMNELVAKFLRLEELSSRLEGPGRRIYDMLLGPPPSQARWADRLAEAAERLEAELSARRLVNAELGARPGAGQCRWIVFTGSIFIYGGRVARRPNLHHGCQWSPLGDWLPPCRTS